MTNTELSERQETLFQWRDYFKLLRKGVVSQGSDKTGEVRVWLDVIITELESDIQHLECGQERFCRFDEPEDLSEIDNNILVGAESRGSGS